MFSMIWSLQHAPPRTSYAATMIINHLNITTDIIVHAWHNQETVTLCHVQWSSHYVNVYKNTSPMLCKDHIQYSMADLKIVMLCEDVFTVLVLATFQLLHNMVKTCFDNITLNLDALYQKKKRKRHKNVPQLWINELMCYSLCCWNVPVFCGDSWTVHSLCRTDILSNMPLWWKK